MRNNTRRGFEAVILFASHAVFACFLLLAAIAASNGNHVEEQSCLLWAIAVVGGPALGFISREFHG